MSACGIYNSALITWTCTLGTPVHFSNIGYGNRVAADASLRRFLILTLLVNELLHHYTTGNTRLFFRHCSRARERALSFSHALLAKTALRYALEREILISLFIVCLTINATSERLKLRPAGISIDLELAH
jgi:hypothetical protein